MKKQIEMIVFDMDGVIVNSEPLHENARQMMFQKYGILPDDRMPEAVGKSCSGFWRKVGEIYHVEEDPFVLEKEQYSLVALQIEQNKLSANEGLLEVIREYKRNGRKIGLASSSTRVLVDDTLRLLGLKDMFDYTVSGDEVERKKPAPDIYEKVLHMAGVSETHAVAVEDSKSGVEAARAAGLYCFGYRNPTSGEQDLSEADQEIDRLTEILDLASV